jgi:hypothetical protein
VVRQRAAPHATGVQYPDAPQREEVDRRRDRRQLVVRVAAPVALQAEQRGLRPRPDRGIRSPYARDQPRRRDRVLLETEARVVVVVDGMEQRAVVEVHPLAG